MSGRHQRGWLRLERKKKWVLRYRDGDGHECRLDIGLVAQYPTKAAARREADRRMAAITISFSSDTRSITVAAFADIYIKDSIEQMKPTASRSAKSLLLKHVVPVLGQLHFEEITGRWPQQLVNALRDQRLSNKTINNALVVLSRMLVLARRYGHPCAFFQRSLIKMPPAAVDSPRRYYTPEEASQLIEQAEWPWGVLFALYAHLGIRPGEGLGLAWPHINFDDRVVHIRQAAVDGLIQTVKSNNSKADVPLPDPLLILLRAYREDWLPNALELLFATDTGAPWHTDDVRSQFLHPLQKRLSIAHGGLHAFRHGLATNLARAGVAPKVARDMLRHGDMRVTMSYTHTVVDDQRAALNKTSALISSGALRRTDSLETLGNKE